MDSFICKVRTPQGQITKVKMQEKDKITCLKKLKRNGMTPISIEKTFSILNNDKNRKKQKNITATIHSKKKKLNINLDSELQLSNRVTIDEIKKFTQDFFILRKSNFNNSYALSTIINNTENTYFKEVLTKILKNLKSGIYMYKTMREYNNIFPSVYINFIKTGELTNNLDEFLKYAITYLDDEQKINDKIKNELVPSIVVFLGIIIVTILAVMLGIPNFHKLLQSSGNNILLPRITTIIVNFINCIIHYWYILVVLVIILFGVIFKLKNTEKGRYKYDSFKYNNFLFGRLSYLVDFSRILKSISLNVHNKMRLQDALEISKNVTNNTYIISQIEEAISNIYIGKNWISPFENDERLNSIIIEMVKKAYNTKSLKTLELTIEYLDEEIEKETNKVLKKLPEISYVFVGIALLLFMLLFLIPCIQIYLGGFLFI